MRQVRSLREIAEETNRMARASIIGHYASIGKLSDEEVAQQKHTKIINLYAGPGVGKSVAAAQIFAELKKQQVNCELVQEYIKSWAWEDRTPVINDQFYIFGKQSRREYILHNKVDVIVTDSPLAICAYCSHVYGSPEFSGLFIDMYKLFRKSATEAGVEYIDVILRRTKPFQQEGRFQSESEVIEIDKDMKAFLVDKLGIGLVESDPDNVLTDVMKILENK